jgi:hypothetical protein
MTMGVVFSNIRMSPSGGSGAANEVETKAKHETINTARESALYILHSKNVFSYCPRHRNGKSQKERILALFRHQIKESLTFGICCLITYA